MNDTYKKADIDFGYTINRAYSDSKSRYMNSWKKRPGAEMNKAVILCAGDLMCEPAMSEAAYFDGGYFFHPCFKYIAPVLKNSDLAIANLETMVTEKVPYAHEKHRVNHHTGVRYHCNAPLEYLQALRYAGFDGFVLANNHNADGGYEGLMDTLDNLDKMGFMRTGMYKNAEEPRTLVVDVNNIKVGILSYTEHINRDLDKELFTEEGCRVLLNRFSKERLERDIQEARRQGAEFLICYMHFLGKEYSHEVLERQRKTARIVAEAGIDCIMGSHTHSIQEYDILETSDHRKVPVVYSLGNFVTSDGTSLITRKSVIYKLELRKENGKVFISRESYIPCRVIENLLKSGYTVFPTQQKYRGKVNSDLLNKAQEEIIRVMGDKIAVDEGDAVPVRTAPVVSAPAAKLEQADVPFEVKRQLTVDKICEIVGIDINRVDKAFRGKKINYFTARYTWVRKDCAYFSRYLDTEEKEARWAYERGAGVLFCTKQFYTTDGKPLPCIVVDSPIQKFYALNRWLRSLYDVKTIGVTGSVGKTTTKEMLYHVVSAQFNTLKNSGNANTYAAIADTTHKLTREHQVYIQEICAFAPGWVEGGSQMLNAHMCVITNIGYPHVDLYGSIENILKDKTSLIRGLPKDGVAFLNYDDVRLASYQTDKKVISFAIHNEKADYVAKNIQYGEGIIQFDICSKEGVYPTTIHMYGEHNVLNALAAFAVGRHLGISADVILTALNGYRSEGMRQNVCNIGGYNLYMDCYNSAPNSVLTSIHALAIMNPEKAGKKVAVIGDIPRMGKQSEAVHKDVGGKLVDEKIDLYLFFGKYTYHTYEVMKKAGCNVMHTENREELNNWIRTYVKRDDIVLFKAGHPMALAKTVDQVYGTSFHLEDGDVLLENSKTANTLEYDARWIDGVVEIRKGKGIQSKISIPELINQTAVGRLGKEAFQGKRMKALSLPKTVYNIGENAFKGCAALEEITFSDGLLVLEKRAFSGCTALKKVRLPETLIEIGEKAFEECSNLKSIYIPDSVGHICDDAFEGCGDAVICCHDGSYAQKYADEQGLRCEIVSGQ